MHLILLFILLGVCSLPAQARPSSNHGMKRALLNEFKKHQASQSSAGSGSDFSAPRLTFSDHMNIYQNYMRDSAKTDWDRYFAEPFNLNNLFNTPYTVFYNDISGTFQHNSNGTLFDLVRSWTSLSEQYGEKLQNQIIAKGETEARHARHLADNAMNDVADKQCDGHLKNVQTSMHHAIAMQHSLYSLAIAGVAVPLLADSGIMHGGKSYDVAIGDMIVFPSESNLVFESGKQHFAYAFHVRHSETTPVMNTFNLQEHGRIEYVGSFARARPDFTSTQKPPEFTTMLASFMLNRMNVAQNSPNTLGLTPYWHGSLINFHSNGVSFSESVVAQMLSMSKGDRFTGMTACEVDRVSAFAKSVMVSNLITGDWSSGNFRGRSKTWDIVPESSLNEKNHDLFFEIAQQCQSAPQGRTLPRSIRYKRAIEKLENVLSMDFKGLEDSK